MNQAKAIGRLSILAVGLGIGAALADTPGVAWADDFQISIDGMDLLPTAGNTATATSEMGDIAIAIGNGAGANATGGSGDFAFADGANSIAEAGFNGDYDSAVVFGANSIAEAGFGTFTFPTLSLLSLFPAGPFPSDFDFAAAFGDGLNATATGGFLGFLSDIMS